MMAWHERLPSCVSNASNPPVLWDYFCSPEASADDVLLDEEIFLMTDAERAAFAARQCELEEQHFASHYRGRARSASAGTSARCDSIDANRCRGGPRVEDRLLLHHFDRARLLDTLAARHEASLRESLTFRPEINASRGTASRYLEPRRAVRSPVRGDASCFAPTVNRVPPSARGERLGAYLRTPVHRRLSRAALEGRRRMGGLCEGEQKPQLKLKPQLKPQPQEAAPIAAAFLRRLEEADRRRAANRERLARETARQLTFRPALAPGTRRRSASSKCREALDRPRDPPARPEETKASGAAPRINARSREMRRGIEDLRLFELRRQQRLQQLREEREEAARGAAPFAPVVSAGSRRIASVLLGDAHDVHESAQELMQRRAVARAETTRVAAEQRRRQEEGDLTFRPEVHTAPPYLQAIARELAVNKSLAPPQPKQRPSFRFS